MGLWDVHDGTRHASDEDHRSLAIAVDEVAGDGSSEEVSAVDVHSEQLAHALNRVCDGLKVLGEAGGSDEVVDAAVLVDDLGDASVDRLLVGHVGLVGSYSGESDG